MTTSTTISTTRMTISMTIDDDDRRRRPDDDRRVIGGRDVAFDECRERLRADFAAGNSRVVAPP